MTDVLARRDLFEWAADCHGVWTTLANSKAAETVERVRVFDRPFPFFNVPTSLNDDESPLVIPPLARTVTIGVELACRVGLRGSDVRGADGANPVESYHAFVAVRDSSHHEYARECAKFDVGPVTDPDDPTKDFDYEVSRSWADGFAILSRAKREAPRGFPENAAMRLEIDGFPAVATDTSAYVHRFESVIEVITRFVRLDHGDVISLGVAGDVVTLPRGEKLPEGTKLTATVEEVGTLTVPILDTRGEDNYYKSIQSRPVTNP